MEYLWFGGWNSDFEQDQISHDLGKWWQLLVDSWSNHALMMVVASWLNYCKMWIVIFLLEYWKSDGDGDDDDGDDDDAGVGGGGGGCGGGGDGLIWCRVTCMAIFKHQSIGIWLWSNTHAGIKPLTMRIRTRMLVDS